MKNETNILRKKTKTETDTDVMPAEADSGMLLHHTVCETRKCYVMLAAASANCFWQSTSASAR